MYFLMKHKAVINTNGSVSFVDGANRDSDGNFQAKVLHLECTHSGNSHALDYIDASELYQDKIRVAKIYVVIGQSQSNA